MENLFDIAPPVSLTEQEEVILYMLLNNISQKEIAKFLNCTNNHVQQIIIESLYKKFKIIILSTQALIDKAISMGYALLIPEVFYKRQFGLI